MSGDGILFILTISDKAITLNTQIYMIYTIPKTILFEAIIMFFYHAENGPQEVRRKS